jgi:hypothetical protein
MTKNKILWLSISLILLSCLFPPWEVKIPVPRKPIVINAGFAFLFDPPQDNRYQRYPGVAHIDFGILFVEWVIILAVGSGLWLTRKEKPRLNQASESAPYPSSADRTSVTVMTNLKPTPDLKKISDSRKRNIWLIGLIAVIVLLVYLDLPTEFEFLSIKSNNSIPLETITPAQYSDSFLWDLRQKYPELENWSDAELVLEDDLLKQEKKGTLSEDGKTLLKEQREARLITDLSPRKLIRLHLEDGAIISVPADTPPADFNKYVASFREFQKNRSKKITSSKTEEPVNSELGLTFTGKKLEENPNQDWTIMLIFIFFVFYGLYFYYVYKAAAGRIDREYQWGSPSPPKAIPYSEGLLVMLAIPWGIIILGGIYWGWTYPRYPTNDFWIRHDNLDLFFLFIICVTLGLSYAVTYQVGKLSGIADMKNTNLFISYEQWWKTKQTHTEE